MLSCAWIRSWFPRHRAAACRAVPGSQQRRRAYQFALPSYC
jgi:hypothetical protein